MTCVRLVDDKIRHREVKMIPFCSGVNYIMLLVIDFIQINEAAGVSR